MSAWSEHVTVALLGTRRRDVPELAEAALGEEDPAARLLDQAGLLAVQRRAGVKAGTAEPVAPAPAEATPLVPAAAARRLDRILAGDRVRMLPEWLAAAARHGYRVPARNLPELLDKGRGDRSIRPFVARAAGRRGAWLALQNPDWAYLLTESDASVGGLADWETGTRGQRVAFLTGLRIADPAAARARLLEGWARESAPDRAAFLAVFEHGLSADDEEFLERALDDRGKDVRQLAADLLARLPTSAYARRMAGRARSLLRLSGRGSRRVLAVTLPEDHDDAMARDGIPFHPAGSFSPGGRRVGARAAWLREIVARAPLDGWAELFGLPPGELAALPVSDDFARDVQNGWARAAVLQGDVPWARALLGSGIAAAETEAVGPLLGVLGAAERADVAAGLARAVAPGPEVVTLLRQIPGPWEGAVADAAVAALETAAARPDRFGEPARERYLAPLCRLADERLTPAAAPRLAELAARHDGWPLAELSETLRFRHEMLAELSA